MEKILDKRKNKKGKLEYLVRWRGYGSEGDTWEPEGNLSTCMIYVHDFNRQHAEHQRENVLLRSTRRSPNHQSHRQPCTLLLASTAGADVRGSEQVEPAMGLAQPALTAPTGPAALSSQQTEDRVTCSLMPTPLGCSARRSMDLSKMGIKILVPKSPMNSRPDSEEARVQEAHLVPPEVALPEKPAGVQLGPGEERARMGSRARPPHPSSSPAAMAAAAAAATAATTTAATAAATAATTRPLSCPGELLWSCDWVVLPPGLMMPHLRDVSLRSPLSCVLTASVECPPLRKALVGACR